MFDCSKKQPTESGDDQNFPMDLHSRPGQADDKLTAIGHLSQCINILDDMLKEPTRINPHLPIPDGLFDLRIHMLHAKAYLDVQAAKEADDTATKNDPMVATADRKKSKTARKEENLHIETPRVKGLSHIAGLWETKKLLIVSVLLPLQQPQLFADGSNFNSVLLYGPPGTGKTNIVHALAFECDAKLQCISAGSILCSLVGESERNLRAVFEAFKETDEISILFIDEVDGLCQKRSDGEQEHTRRLKTELMCQMSKMAEIRNRFLICATNCPWDLDPAFIRRFQKRIYVPLPDAEERVELLRLFAGERSMEFERAQWQELIDGTKGFSGSDIKNLVQTALNAPIMELTDTQMWKLCPDDTYQPLMATDDFSKTTWIHTNLHELPHGRVRARSVHPQDFLDSLNAVKATVSQSHILQFDRFHSQSVE